ncbi:MAG TPA: hypothetical protein VMS65_15085 [Polyangiaceae bacterium]|nr:hypothetical protein [Polyangiaceae bacterium]
MGMVRGIALLGLALGATTGCGTTATITRNDGTPVEGWILGGTQESVVVDSRAGKRTEIPRNQIADIDHPGNVHAIVGGSVLAYGGIVIASSFPDCRRSSEPGLTCGSALVPALIGAGIFAWGFVTWLGSKDAVDDRSFRPLHSEKPPPRKPPPTAPLADETPAPPALPPPPPPRSPVPSDAGPSAPRAEPPAPSAPEPAPPAEEPSGVTW